MQQAAAALIGDGTEELPILEVTVLVEVAESFFAAHSTLAFDQGLVELLFELLVPEEDVVGTGDVLGVVGSLASAADGVAHLPLLAFVVGEVVEEELGPEVTVPIVKVLEVDHVLVLDVPDVLGVPAAQNETGRHGLVPELAEVDLPVVVVDFGEQDFFHGVLRQGVCSFALVVAPLALFLESLENIEDGGVVLSVVFVEGRQPVVAEDVVDVAAALRDVGLAPIFPALHEKLLHVLVGDVALRRDEVRLSGLPLQTVARREFTCVQLL